MEPMSPIQCAQFEQTLEMQPDGPLSGAADAHMNGCVRCRLLWSDLEAIRTAGVEWGTEEVSPPAHIWTALRKQLESEGLIRERSAQQGWLASWFGAAPRWALAGATVSVLLIAGMLASYQTTEPDVRSALPVRMSIAAVPKVEVSDLGKTLDGDLKRVLDSFPEGKAVLASSLRENLGIVDNLIAVCEKSVREQPDDPMARDYLYGAYQQKAVLLATAMDRSALEGQ
jgi:hypothetical protein